MEASSSGLNLDDLDEPQFSEQTQKLIDEISAQRSKTSILKPDKDLTSLINELFPSEQSLSQLENVISTVEAEIAELDDELAELVESHAGTAQEGEQALLEAQKAMLELEERVESIRGKTQSSDAVVREMTRDIKQLDIAKRNLTSSITTLHHLQILLNGVESLGTWTERRDYASIARQLPAVLNVLQLFERHSAIPQIAAITKELDGLRLRLARQLAADLKHAFQTGALNETVTDMCRVTSALEGNVQEDFCKWFVDQQLSEYGVLYSENEEAAWIDKIEDRYKWFVRKLTDFERTGASKVFPPAWEMGRRLAAAFCTMTCDIFGRMLTRRRLDLEWRLLAHAIQHTKMFEALLVKRFPAKAGYNFDKAIWKAFDPFLDVFISAQEKTLNDFVDECVTRIRNGTECSSRELSVHAIPFPSSADMFLLLKKVITESSKLSSKPDGLLKDVMTVLRRCLRNYSISCLTAFIPSTTAASSNSSAATSAATALFQSLIRDDSSVIRLTPGQQFTTCCILATADWCAETTTQLQEKLAQRLPNVDLNQELEGFYSIANSALTVLVQDVESSCDAALQAMTKISWQGVESVGDESGFISSIRNHLKSSVPALRDLLADRRKYFAHFCLKLATQLAQKFVGALFRCRPLSTPAAEQLLLDTHALKSFLLSLPSVESAVQTRPPIAFISAVNGVLNKAEMMLKVVMADMQSADDFIGYYMRLLPDSDVAELQKVLDMRGLKRAEQAPLVALLRSKKAGVSGGEGRTTDTESTVAPNIPAGSSVPQLGGALASVAGVAEGAAAALQQSNAMSQLSSVMAAAADGLADSSMRRLEKLVAEKREQQGERRNEIAEQQATPADATPAPADKKKSEPPTEAPKPADEQQPATPADATTAPTDKKSEPVKEAPKSSLSPSSTRSDLPFCECAGCPMPPPSPSPSQPRVMLNQWIDVRVSDPWPKHPLVKALDKSLNTIDGQNPDQYVALWYQHGEPVMGRVWKEGGKIAANFAWNNREYTGKVGTIQLLVHTCEHIRGFNYHWKPFSEVVVFGTEREFVPVHVDRFRGDIAPAVITFNGKQILGKCDLRNEKASAGFGGKENIVDGPPVHPVTIVLTRKARTSCKFD